MSVSDLAIVSALVFAWGTPVGPANQLAARWLPPRHQDPNGITSQRSRSSPWQQDRHHGRRTTLPFLRLTQNPAGPCRQWMQSWTVRGSMPGAMITRCGGHEMTGSNFLTSYGLPIPPQICGQGGEDQQVGEHDQRDPFGRPCSRQRG
jgi:hypothetical protein